MLSTVREKFGALVVGGIMALIAFVFVFEGIVRKSATNGLHEDSVAGTVNGEPISISDFNRELNRRIEFFKGMAGGKITEEQLAAFQVRQGVFQELARKKLMVQEAQHQDMMPSDEEVRDQIRQIPAFQKDGRFDVLAYKRTLEANNYTPGHFEKMIREDLAMQRWQDFFKKRVHVSDLEVRQQFEAAGDKRVFKYVLLTTEGGKKNIQVTPDEIQKFLADPQKQNLAKSQFEARKEVDLKGKTFDQAKEQLARESIQSSKVTEIAKSNEKLAEQVAAVMDASKGSDAKVAELVKPVGGDVKTSAPVSRSAPTIPGVGEVPELTQDAFAAKSPIDATQGGKAKVYRSAAGVLVALVTSAEKADPAKLTSEREQIIEQISFRKEREMFDSWVRKLASKAKIDSNTAVVGGAGAGSES